MFKLNVFPKPYKAEREEGQFHFYETDKLYFVINSNFSNKAFIEKCPELWNNFTAGKSNITVVLKDNVKTAFIAKSADFTPETKLEDGCEYTLECTENGIALASACDIGVIHAFSSLLQIISAYSLKNHDFTIPCIKISDKPLLEMRAFHLCVFPETTLLFLEKVVNLCGLLKCTHIILEFWGMYKFEFMPELSRNNAYTKDELQKIIFAGKSFGMEFIPMFNHIGHAAQSRFKTGKNVLLDNAPEYEEYFVPGGWTWNVENEDVLKLLENARDELCDVFGEGEYFHIGCDEVYIADLADDELQAKRGSSFVKFVNQTAKSLEAKGRKTIIWGDMFLDSKKFSFPTITSYLPYDFDNNLASIDKNVLIADWQYNIPKKNDETVKYLLEKRDPKTLILSPWDGLAEVASAEENILGRIQLADENGLKGVIATTWNNIYNDPRNLIYAACQMWSDDPEYLKLRTWETYKCFGLQNLRKLMPCKGDSDKAGWWTGELFSASI